MRVAITKEGFYEVCLDLVTNIDISLSSDLCTICIWEPQKQPFFRINYTDTDSGKETIKYLHSQTSIRIEASNFSLILLDLLKPSFFYIWVVRRDLCSGVTFYLSEVGLKSFRADVKPGNVDICVFPSLADLNAVFAFGYNKNASSAIINVITQHELRSKTNSKFSCFGHFCRTKIEDFSFFHVHRYIETNISLFFDRVEPTTEAVKTKNSGLSKLHPIPTFNESGEFFINDTSILINNFSECAISSYIEIILYCITGFVTLLLCVFSTIHYFKKKGEDDNYQFLINY